MVEEGLYSPDLPVRFRVTGEAGNLPATIATPLAVILTELLQNAVDHAYTDGSGIDWGQVFVDVSEDGAVLTVSVVDDGVGVPEDFSIDATSGLGLSIVRTLVTSELGGTITMRRGDGDTDRPGTIVTMHVPLSEGAGA
jgi:two-component sensor histidine kinase